MKYIFGNWKMNHTSTEARQFVAEFKRQKLPQDTVFGIAVPFPYIKEINKKLGKKCKIGAQNVSFASKGAFTGEVSAEMLLDCGASFCLVGHSERRQLLGVTDQQINQKLLQLKNFNITPILCVGESCEEYKDNKTEEVLTRQLKEGLKGLKYADVAGMIVAYEPVWAIGTGKTASLRNIKRNLSFIRKALVKILGKHDIKVLYGGSVTESNAEELLSDSSVDGALVGGASLKASSLVNIGRNIRR